MDEGSGAEESGITLRIKFKSDTLEQFIARYGADVTPGGIFIRTKDPLSVGTVMRFDFTLLDGSPLLGGRASVVWTREADPSRSVAPGMGVRFDELNPDSEPVLQKILAEKGKREGTLPGTAPMSAQTVAPVPTPFAPAASAPVATRPEAVSPWSPGGAARSDEPIADPWAAEKTELARMPPGFADGPAPVSTQELTLSGAMLEPPTPPVASRPPTPAMGSPIGTPPPLPMDRTPSPLAKTPVPTGLEASGKPTFAEPPLGSPLAPPPPAASARSGGGFRKFAIAILVAGATGAGGVYLLKKNLGEQEQAAVGTPVPTEPTPVTPPGTPDPAIAPAAEPTPAPTAAAPTEATPTPAEPTPATPPAAEKPAEPAAAAPTEPAPKAEKAIEKPAARPAPARPAAPAPKPVARRPEPRPEPSAPAPSPATPVQGAATAEETAPAEEIYMLRVRSTPPGAEVLIDGQVEGKTPFLRRIFDPARPYAITVRKDGFEAHEQMISQSDDWVKKGNERTLTLTPKLAKKASGTEPVSTPPADPAAPAPAPAPAEPAPAPTP